MSFQVEKVGCVSVVTLQGRLVTEVAQELKVAFDIYVAANPGDTVLDMSAVRYVGSYLVGVLVALRTNLETQGATLHFAALDPKVRFVLGVSGLEQLFTYHASRDEAIACVTSRRAAAS